MYKLTAPACCFPDNTVVTKGLRGTKTYVLKKKLPVRLDKGVEGIKFNVEKGIMFLVSESSIEAIKDSKEVSVIMDIESLYYFAIGQHHMIMEEREIKNSK